MCIFGKNIVKVALFNKSIPLIGHRAKSRTKGM